MKWTDIVLQPGEQIRVILVFNGLRTEPGKAAHEPIRCLVVHFKKVLELFSGFCFLFFALGKAGQKRYDQF